MSLTVFYSSVSSSNEMKKRQCKIFSVLDSKKIPYEKVDISQNSADRDRMRTIAGNEKALPPQICIGDNYIGGFDDFDEAIEAETLGDFLKGKK